MRTIISILFLTAILHAEDVYLVKSDEQSARQSSHDAYKRMVPDWKTNTYQTVYLVGWKYPTNKSDTRVALVIPTQWTNHFTLTEKPAMESKSSVNSKGWDVKSNEQAPK